MSFTYAQPEQIANTTEATGNADVSAIGGRGYVAVWTAKGWNPDGPELIGVFGQAFDYSGQKIGSQFIVSTNKLTGEKFEPAVADLGQGAFAVSWTTLDGSFTGVHTRVFAPGLFNGPEVQAHASIEGSQERSDLAGLGDRTYVVTWIASTPDSSRYYIAARRFNDSGAPVGAEFEVNTSSVPLGSSPSISALAGGGYVIAWESGAFDVVAQRFTASGAKVGGEILLNTTTDGSQRHVSIAGLKDGGFVAVWSSTGTNTSDLFGQRFNANGQKVGLEFEVTDLAEGSRPDVTALGDGGFAVAFQSSFRAMIRRYDSAGVPQGTEWPLREEDNFPQLRPAAAMLDDGSFVTVLNGDKIYTSRLFVSDVLTEGAEKSMGTQNSDFIEGYAGDDELRGGGGDDIIEGGLGADRIIGGAGFDVAGYTGASAAVTLNLLTGGHGGEALGDTFGDIEQYALTRFDDRFTGGVANDSVRGLAGADLLIGGGGNDMLDGGDGDDVLEGGAGADALIGGAGDDEASYVRDGAAVTINLLTGQHQGAAAGDSFSSIERFTLGRFDDLFIGGDGFDRVSGGQGNDDLRGGGGNDLLFGDIGNDILDGGTGTDQMHGGVGDDRYLVNLASDSIFEAPGEGFDTVLVGFNYTLGANLEGLTLTGDAAVSGIGNELDNLLTGNAARNTLSGGAGNDRFVTGGALDAVDGGAGTDTLALRGASSGYRIFSFQGGDYVTGMGEGARIANVEQFQFTNTTLNLAQFNAAKVAFNPLIYAASHRDLALAFGTDQTAATNHFANSGLAELRDPAAFDPRRYVASNPDLIKAFGMDSAAATNHYLRFGAAEGRSTDAFDPLNYAASYRDLALAFGRDTAAATNHYIVSGFNEGRVATLFNPLHYVASNTDLIPTIKANTLAATNHYLDFGARESRATSSFDPIHYAATNVDLIAPTGVDRAALIRHWVSSGFNEGRSATGFDPVAYLLTYSDLGTAGFGPSGALRHWVFNGVRESRIGDALFGRDQASHNVAVGGKAADALGTAGERDWFQVQLTAGQKVNISVNSEAFDPALALHNSRGRQLAFDLDGGDSNDPLINFTAAESGLYYLVVTSTGGAGSYTVDVAAGI